MNDRYERIRAALAMGPTPGPWQDIGPIGAGKLIKAPERLIAVVYGPNVNPASEANAHLIAACDPDTIRALLAERDDVLENGKQAVRWAPSSAHWSNELKRLFGEDAREGIDALEARLRAAQAERDALRDALETIAAYPYSRDQEMGATAMRKVARDALSATKGDAQPVAWARYARTGKPHPEIIVSRTKPEHPRSWLPLFDLTKDPT